MFQVKHHRARLVIGWVTAWEYRVPQKFSSSFSRFWTNFNVVFCIIPLETTPGHPLATRTCIVNHYSTRNVKKKGAPCHYQQNFQIAISSLILIRGTCGKDCRHCFLMYLPLKIFSIFFKNENFPPIFRFFIQICKQFRSL